MSEFLGSRISLISKSDIRYSGILHEINSEESTVSLENVRSFGTEGRRGSPEEELPPSDQVYEYIVFRGSDVKDLRIEEAPVVKENKPPTMPDDPAIVGARARPVGPPGPPGPPGAAPPGPSNPPAGFNASPFQQPGFYPPPGPGHWGGRGGGPGPGPGPGHDPRFAGMPYPPPPGWFPPGQGFPPGAPGPWNNFGYPPGPHGPPGAPGASGMPGAPAPGMRGTPQQDKPTPIGAGPAGTPGADRSKQAGTPSQTNQASEAKPGQTPAPSTSVPGPAPPVDSKPSVEEVKATAQSLNAAGPIKGGQQNNIPTGPKNTRITPAVPFPNVGKPTASFPQIGVAAAVKPAEQSNPAATAASIRDATQQAKAAVAVAMAKLGGDASVVPDAGPASGTGSAMDNLTKKVNEMRVNAPRGGSGGRGGRGRGNRAGGGAAKVEVPDSDYDFQTANAKFNKEELVKEAIAGSPLGEVPNGAEPSVLEEPSSDQPAPAQAYNKTRSFFDNISSEARERAESGGQKPGGREWRGEEQRKNMETFGQGSVDGGYRSNYRGRGRGRGRGGGGGRGRGSGPQGRGGFRPRGDAQGVSQ